MKKTVFYMIMAISVLLLSGCLEDKFDGNSNLLEEKLIGVGITDEMIQKITVESTYKDVIETLGEPNSYGARGEVLTNKQLPSIFYMKYEGIVFQMEDFVVSEIRIITDSHRYDDKFFVGQSKEEALNLLSPPIRVITGKSLNNEHFTLYNDITFITEEIAEEREVSYYDDPINRTRIWFEKDLVTAIYYYNTKHYKADKEGFNIKYGLGGSIHNSGKFVTQIKNDVTYEFENDPDIQGTWKYIDYLIRKDEFEPETKMAVIELDDLEIQEDGRVDKSVYVWTNGFFVNLYYNTVYQYEIELIEGKEYMFINSGTDRNIYYYVLERVE